MGDKKTSNIDVENLQQLMMGGGRKNMQEHNQNKKQKQKNSFANKNGNNNKGNNNKGTGHYVGAPYNFVPFSNRVYEYPKEKKVKQNAVADGLLTGEISYEITAKTPIMVDDGTGKFHKNPDGKYSIPGSTMRGLIRNNVQILGFSSFYEDIDDYALMYRNVASGAKQDKDRYNKILGTSNQDDEMRGIARNVKAGYIFQKHGKYYITEINEKYDKNVNYLMLSSKLILSEKKNYPFFIDNWKEKMMYKKCCIFVRKEIINGGQNEKKKQYIYETENPKEVEEYIEDGCFSYEGVQEKNNKIIIDKMGKPGEYSKVGNAKIKNNKIDRRISYEPREKNMINRDYEPYYDKVYYSVDHNKRKVNSVKSRGTNCIEKNMQKGYVLSSGWMNNKKNVYIIPEVKSKPNEENSIAIKEEDVKAFKADYTKRFNTLRQYFGGDEKEKKAQKFFGLPKEGEMKPVFYIDLNGRLYFGFTPRLRLFYDHTILDGLNKNHKEGIMDYSKAIFGYSNKKGSCRSKVSFSDAVIWNTDVKEMEEEQYILSEPKPTSYLDYLEQPEKKDPSTYNDNNLKLRGVKQYWLHSDTVPNKQTSKNKAAVSKFHPLPEETKFEGKVRFRNMTRDEFGLLLWSMQLEENSQMNIGKAKAYGYGNIKLSVKEARCINKQKAYQTECLTLNPLEKIKIKPLIDEYKAEIQKFLGSKDLMEWPNIRDFFNMKDVTKIPDKNTIKYMSITEKDYQNRKKALPKVGNVIKKK